ncbi:NADH-quinone oxidoreductase subunit C [Prosthecobacter sp.]|uniref:NADH-quinone oxidoreductase subunit C n=1 Tax=Prosthecobacter sp. TaxID=1965333 RepID=UPI0037838FF1
MKAPQMVEALKQKFSDAVLETKEFRGEHTLVVKLASAKPLLKYCRDELNFDYLVDVSSLDYMGREPRFEMVYELYGYGHLQHLRVRAAVAEDEEVPTVSDLWPTANWHEREVYDMMGIKFSGHPDLRRILMWEGFPFFPLRKDFPLEGKPSDMPEVGFSKVAPMADGPFVTAAGATDKVHAEPRSRRPVE